MAFRLRRQHRYRIMRESGFLKTEASVLSVVPFKVPYILPMIRDRRKSLERALARGWSRARFDEATRRDYREKGWYYRTKTGRILPQPWDMLREWEDKYRAKHPEYESPWEPRQRRFRKSIRKIEATQFKYPAGRAYPRKRKTPLERYEEGRGR